MAYSNLKDNYSDGIEMVLPLNFKLLSTDRLQVWPVSDAAPDGWGKPFFDAEGNPINPPLGTVGGTPKYVEFRGTMIDTVTVKRGLPQKTGAYYLADGDQPTTGAKFYYYPGLRKNGKDLLADNTYVGDQLVRMCYIRKVTEAGVENTYAHFVTITQEEGSRLDDSPNPDIFSHPEIAAAPHLPYGYYNRYIIRTWRKKINDPDNNDPVLLATYTTPFAFHDSEGSSGVFVGSRGRVAANEARELIAGTATGSVPAKMFQSNCNAAGTGYLCILATWADSCHYIFRINMITGAVTLETLSWTPDYETAGPGSTTNNTLEFIPTAETTVVVNGPGIEGPVWRGYVGGVLQTATFTSLSNSGSRFMLASIITFPDGYTIQVYDNDPAAYPSNRVWGVDFLQNLCLYAVVESYNLSLSTGISRWFLRKDGVVTEVGVTDASMVTGFNPYAFVRGGFRQKECLALGHTFRLPAPEGNRYTFSAKINYNNEMATAAGGLGSWNNLNWYTITEAPVGIDIDGLLALTGANPRLRAVQGYV